MSLTERELADLVAELRVLEGSIVQKIWLAEPRLAFLELRRVGESRLLSICAESGRTRLHVAGERPASPERPFAFQGLLRAEVLGFVLERVEVLPGERAALLRLRGRDHARTLVAELTGRHGNLLLLDEQGTVLGSAVPNLSKVRDNRPGRPYQPPLPLPTRPPGDERSRFEAGPGPFPLSWAVEAAYRGLEKVARVDGRRNDLLGALRARRARLERTLEKVRGDVRRAALAEEHRRRGELLKANLSSITRGMTEARLTEWTEEGPREVVVRLDPTFGPRENLERSFRQYRRLTAGQVKAAARLTQLEAELGELDLRRAEIERLSEEELLRPAGDAPAPPPCARAAQRLPYREFVSGSGQRIRVGRGSKDNDALTFRHSRGDHLWLHARGAAGAHVVVPLNRDEQPTAQTLHDAALLAAHHSDARGGSVDVAVTRVKYVRKVKGAPGAVTFSQDRTVSVQPDPERLARLRRPDR